MRSGGRSFRVCVNAFARLLKWVTSGAASEGAFRHESLVASRTKWVVGSRSRARPRRCRCVRWATRVLACRAALFLLPFAGIATFPPQLLVNVGTAAAYGSTPAGTGRKTLGENEPSYPGSGVCSLSAEAPRIFDDALPVGVRTAPIEDAHRTDEPMRPRLWQPRCGVEGDDVADVGGATEPAGRSWVITRPAQEAVQSRASLAPLRSHPIQTCSALVPSTAAGEREGSLAAVPARHRGAGSGGRFPHVPLPEFRHRPA